VIKFTHAYRKLNNAEGVPVKRARLLDVVEVNLNSLSKSFIAYDTDNGLYALPKSGDYLMLIFLKPFGDLFTTLRPTYSPKPMLSKREYYRRLIGREFEIVILSQDKKHVEGFKHKSQHED